jgi:hypothetical protein
MTEKDRQEIGYIFGQIVACLNAMPETPYDKLEELIDSVISFNLKDFKRKSDS